MAKEDRRIIAEAEMEEKIQSLALKKDSKFKLEGPWKKFRGKRSGQKVYAVDFAWVYSNLSVLFHHGGHGYVHEFIPLDEIWVSYNHHSSCKCKKIRKDNLLSRANVEVIYNTNVKEIKGNGQLVHSVVLKKSKGQEVSLEIDALFLAIGANPNTQFFSEQIQLDDFGYVILKKGAETSIPGVFAAGDVADPVFKQAVIASGDGAKAAMQAIDYLHLNAASAKRERVESEAKGGKAPQVIEITTVAELKELVLSSKEMVLVDFYATWCAPCRHLGKFTEGWAQDLKGKAVICKVNVDLGKELAIKYRIQSMPTVIAINSEGREVARKVGIEEIVQYVNKLKNSAG